MYNKPMIEFRNLTKKPIKTATFARLARKVFKNRNFELSVVFAGGSLMRTLNRERRGKNKIANVLSFLLEESSSDARSERGGRGEIFLHRAERDLPHLFVHGCLHLLGYDHQNEKEAIHMEQLEHKILSG